eukprot:TRINITY_DN106_c0_g1_i1.p1 TRINITY_DN106_c0_g1~~TRINITY_DN106_c0_g1_i1.p1  ORF type:complete len:490 (-),score=108.57 TRINITY_DN106_c0_g1_i1:481-1950(-)
MSLVIQPAVSCGYSISNFASSYSMNNIDNALCQPINESEESNDEKKELNFSTSNSTSSASSPVYDGTENVSDDVKLLLERYQYLVHQEADIIQKLRNSPMHEVSLQLNDVYKNIGHELYSVLSQKLREVQLLVGPSFCFDTMNVMNEIKTEFNGYSPEVLANPLILEAQPQGNVVANKYLEPAIIARVAEPLKHMALEGRLQVVASLCLAVSEQTLYKTVDNKQDILQGVTTVPVGPDGSISFSKLKIMEVSSKHHHQTFAISLQLQEIRVANTINGNNESVTVSLPVGAPLKLAPLHVQSRINKRKRSSSSTQPQPAKPRKRVRGESDSNYVDITDLLTLPQKEAASRLGISESMLCKRFKECTRRKWPYRYLRKIDKMIRLLTLNKKNDPIPCEDIEKIQQLQKEREECLHPVKIRITGQDKLPNLRRSGGYNEDTFDEDDLEFDRAVVSESESESNDSSETNKQIDDDDEEIWHVASTLNLLKQAV